MKVKLQNHKAWIIPKKLEREPLPKETVIIEHKGKYYVGSGTSAITNTFLSFARNEITYYKFPEKLKKEYK